MPYRVFTPRDIEPGRTYPLVLYLHGGLECGTDNLAQVALIPQFLEPIQRRFPTFLVAPQIDCCEGCTWARDNVYLVAGVLSEVEDRWPAVDSRRIYVTGASLGGRGVFRQLETFTRRYAAAVPLASGFVHADRAAAIAPSIAHIPTWIFHGALDTVAPVSQSDVIVEELRRAGGLPRYTVFPDLGHDIAARVYSDPDDELFPWLFGQILPSNFRRGDSNGDGMVDISDPVHNLEYQFLGTAEPGCLDACDFDDSGTIELTDAVSNLEHQFLGGPAPAPPAPDTCGPDERIDLLGCASFEPCSGEE